MTSVNLPEEVCRASGGQQQTSCCCRPPERRHHRRPRQRRPARRQWQRLFYAKDGVRDTVNGGPGTDIATVDPKLDKLIAIERHNKK